MAHKAWIIRRMTQEDMKHCLDIWSQADLNEGIADLECYFKSDESAFHVAESTQEPGKILGMIGAPRAHANTKFLGFFAVIKSHRKQGIGNELWKKATELETVNIGLNSVASMFSWYMQNGFTLKDSRQMVVYKAHSKDLQRELPRPDHKAWDVKHYRGMSDQRLISELIEYDESISGLDRTESLRLKLSHDKVRVVLVRCDSNFRILGYACMTPDNKGGEMISPLYADNIEICEALMADLVASVPEEDKVLSFMMLAPNKYEAAFQAKSSISRIEECGRLFTKEIVAPRTPDRIFCMHSPNFALF